MPVVNSHVLQVFPLGDNLQFAVTENLLQCWKQRNNWDRKISDTVKIRAGALVS
jgi:hypothetical protein